MEVPASSPRSRPSDERPHVVSPGFGLNCSWFVFHVGASKNETSLRPSAPSQNLLWSRFNDSTVPWCAEADPAGEGGNASRHRRLNVKGEDATPFSSPRVFLAIRSMSAIGIVCHWSLVPPAATRFPSSIIIVVIVLPHRGHFRRGPLMRNTCSK